MNRIIAMPSIQAPAAVVMVRPHRFAPNPETAVDNAFQRLALTETAQAVASTAYREVTSAPLSVPTIETAGGSVRCVIAGVHLSPRTCVPALESRR